MKTADRLKVVATGADASVVTLGAAAKGCRTLAAAITAGALTVGDTGIEFCIEDDLGNWEIGRYTITSTTQITRQAVLASSNDNSSLPAAFPGGVKNAFLTVSSDLLGKVLTAYVVTNGANFSARVTAAANKAHADGGGVVYIPPSATPYMVENEILLDTLKNVTIEFAPGVVLQRIPPLVMQCTLTANSTTVLTADTSGLRAGYYTGVYIRCATPGVIANNVRPQNIQPGKFDMSYSTAAPYPTGSFKPTQSGTFTLIFHHVFSIFRQVNCTNVALICPNGWATLDFNDLNSPISNDTADSLRNCVRTEGGSGIRREGLVYLNPYYHGEIGVPSNPTDTVSISGTFANNASSVTLTSAAGVKTGMAVSGTGIPGGTTVVGLNGTTVLLSNRTTSVQAGVTLKFATPSVCDHVYINRVRAIGCGYRSVHYHADENTLVKDFTLMNVESEDSGRVSRRFNPTSDRTLSGIFVGLEYCYRYHIDKLTFKRDTGTGLQLTGTALGLQQGKNFCVGTVQATDVYKAVALMGGARNVTIDGFIASSSTPAINIGGCTLINGQLDGSVTVVWDNPDNSQTSPGAKIGTIGLPTGYDMSTLRTGQLVFIGTGTTRLWVHSVDAVNGTITVYVDNAHTTDPWAAGLNGTAADIIVWQSYSAYNPSGDYSKTNNVTENIHIGSIHVEHHIAAETCPKSSITGLTGATTLSSTTITGISSTTNLKEGFIVAGAGIPDGTVVTSVSTSSITMSQAATATASGVPLTFIPYNARGLKISSFTIENCMSPIRLYNVEDWYIGSLSVRNSGRQYSKSDGSTTNDATNLSVDLQNTRLGHIGQLVCLDQQVGGTTRANSTLLSIGNSTAGVGGAVVDVKIMNAVVHNSNASNGNTNAATVLGGYGVMIGDLRNAYGVKLAPTMPNAACVVNAFNLP